VIPPSAITTGIIQASSVKHIVNAADNAPMIFVILVLHSLLPSLYAASAISASAADANPLDKYSTASGSSADGLLPITVPNRAITTPPGKLQKKTERIQWNFNARDIIN
jgi:hypothetical protein